MTTCKLNEAQFDALYSLAYWVHECNSMREHCGEYDPNTEYFHKRFLQCLYSDVYPLSIPAWVVDVVIEYASGQGYSLENLIEHMKSKNIFV